MDAPLPLELDETALHMWRRRVVSIPGLFALGGAAVWSTPLLAPALVLRDLARGDGRLPALRAWVSLVGNLAVHEAGVAWLLAVWARARLSGAFSGAAPDDEGRAAYDVERHLASTLLAMLERVYDVTIEVDGADVLGPEPTLILARHTSLIDPLLVMALTGPQDVRVRYVAKRELLWDPCIDILGHRFPLAFVERGGRAHQHDLAAVEHLADHLDAHEAVLVFPEGTRFSADKRARALARLHERHSDLGARAAALTHVLPPHPGGVLALLARDRTDDVVVCAHAGLEGISHIRDFIDGALIGRTLRVRFWRVPRAEVPEAPDDQVDWLYTVFEDIDRWVGAQPVG